MKLFKSKPKYLEMDDSNLVLASLGGDRDAYCQIVVRYQNLLCSVAFSSVGDVKLSEDIAQETFIEGWKKLGSLAEPTKLRAWLCGILRFKVSHEIRKTKSSPTQNAEPINEFCTEQNPDLESDTHSPEQISENAQQRQLMWAVLNDIDELYREPLVLFYREQESVERVAEVLDITTDTAKQRLSRGRKMLKSALTDLVENGLRSTAPGVAFTSVVMTSILSLPAPAAATTIGAGAAKSGLLGKATSTLTVFAAFSGLVSSYFGLRSGLAQTRTQRERANVIKYVSLFFIFVAVYIVGILTLNHLALNSDAMRVYYSVGVQVWAVGFVLTYIALTLRMLTAQKDLRAQERIFAPESFAEDAHQPNAKQREYKSRLHIFGVPLFHFQFGMPEHTDKTAFAWFAGGSKAYGLIFAWGGIAIAPISVGIIAVGAFSIGAVGIGLLGIGTVGVGLVGFGASAIGYKAYASFSALGLESAFSNGVSIAMDAAIAPVAYASHVNSELAYQLSSLETFTIGYPWLLLSISLLVILPAAWYSKTVRQRMS